MLRSHALLCMLASTAQFSHRCLNCDKDGLVIRLRDYVVDAFKTGRSSLIVASFIEAHYLAINRRACGSGKQFSAKQSCTVEPSRTGITATQARPAAALARSLSLASLSESIGWCSVKKCLGRVSKSEWIEWEIKSCLRF